MRYEFAVLYEQRTVGKAEIVKQGLYYRITCRYRLPSGEVCRLIFKWPGGWENVGIPVPEGDGFNLTKKIPVKKIPILDMTVHLMPAEVRPDDLERNENTADPEVPEIDLPEQGSADNDPAVIGSTGPIVLPVFDDLPFDALDQIEKARSVTIDEQSFLAFGKDDSDLQQETDGTVIGAEDIGIDGSLDDVLSEPV